MHRRWTQLDDNILIGLSSQRFSIVTLAEILERTESAVKSRRTYLNLKHLREHRNNVWQARKLVSHYK